MPMHIPLNIDTDSSSIATLLSGTGPITSPLPPTIQSDILGILQREQDHAISLLSLSPLLASLFISYANRAAALESASATPSSDSEEWKALHATITVLREENEKLKSETQEMAEKLKTAEASHEAFRSQVSYLKEANTSQRDDIKSLQAELLETNDWHDKLMVDSSAERAALQIQVSDLEVQRHELKDAIVEQQIKISKLERQGLNSLPDLSTPTTPSEATAARELHNIDDPTATGIFARTSKTERQEMKARKEKEFADREAKEQAEKAAREEVDPDISKEAKIQEAGKVQREAKGNEEAGRKDLSSVPQPATGRNPPSNSEEGNSKSTPTRRPTKSTTGSAMPCRAPQNPVANDWLKSFANGF